MCKQRFQSKIKSVLKVLLKRAFKNLVVVYFVNLVSTTNNNLFLSKYQESYSC